MARLNEVRLYSYIANPPKIFYNDDKTPLSASFTTVVANGKSDVSGNSLKSLSFDYPFIYTKNQEIIEQLKQIKVGNFVRIEGIVCSKTCCNKVSFCTHCNEKNILQGTTVYVYPTYVEIDKGEFTEDINEALNILMKKHKISNRVLAMGTVLEDPILYQKEGHMTNTGYRLAVGRSIKIAEDASNIKTDYPRIVVFGKNAVSDAKCLYNGSLVLVDGYIQTREIERKTLCESCNKEYVFNEAVCEIVSKSTEYLENYNTPEDLEISEQIKAEEIEKKIFGDKKEEKKTDYNQFFQNDDDDFDDEFDDDDDF